MGRQRNARAELADLRLAVRTQADARGRPAAVWAALALLIAGLAGCGSLQTGGAVAAQVGGATIYASEVRHWAHVLAGGSGLAERRRALDYLIAARWLEGEARELRLPVHDRDVLRQVARELSLPDLPPTGAAQPGARPTDSDSRLKARVAVISLELRQALRERMAPVSRAQVEGYYRRNIERFQAPERREFDIVSSLTLARAERIEHEVQSGRRFASMALRESMERLPESQVRPGDRAIARAIFAATPHVLGGPVALLGRYHALFEVTRVIPTVHRSLGEAARMIERRIEGERARAALAAFLASSTRRWSAATWCRSWFASPRCALHR